MRFWLVFENKYLLFTLAWHIVVIKLIGLIGLIKSCRSATRVSESRFLGIGRSFCVRFSSSANGYVNKFCIIRTHNMFRWTRKRSSVHFFSICSATPMFFVVWKWGYCFDRSAPRSGPAANAGSAPDLPFFLRGKECFSAVRYWRFVFRDDSSGLCLPFGSWGGVRIFVQKRFAAAAYQSLL